MKTKLLFACILLSFYVNTIFSQRISSFTILDSNAALVSYPKLGQYFTYSKLGWNGFFNVYTMKLDGTNKYCWTCNDTTLPRSNAHPEWHPSMKYIIFEGEKKTNTKYTHPGFGWYYDLWAVDINTGSKYLLRDAEAAHPSSSLTGVLHPHFSHDGKKLVWAELHGSILNWQDYSIMIADYKTTPYPHLDNIIDLYNPAYGIVEPQGFSFNNDKLLFAGNNDWFQSSVTLDLFYLELDTNYTLKTPTPFAVSKSNADWAEAAKFTPNDQKIIFSTTIGYPVYPDSAETAFEWRRSEYWVCDANGNNPKQLSYFMHKDSLEFMADTSDAADFDISPSGNELIATVNTSDKIYVVKMGIDWGSTTSTGNNLTQNETLSTRQLGNTLYIDVSGMKNNTANLVLYDYLGKEIGVLANNIDGSNFNTILFNTSSLKNGIYFISLAGTNVHKSKKILISN